MQCYLQTTFLQVMSEFSDLRTLVEETRDAVTDQTERNAKVRVLRLWQG